MGISEIIGNRPAVFLDRDGIINLAIVQDGIPHPPPDVATLKIVPDAARILRRLRDCGFTLIVVTNQPDVARGTQTRAAVETINAVLARELPIDDILVCYHDDAAGCDCRKPNPGLVLRAAHDYDIDLTRSFLIGDRWKDVEAGRRAGVRTVFVDYSYDEQRPQPPANATVISLRDAVDWIIKQPV